MSDILNRDRLVFFRKQWRDYLFLSRAAISPKWKNSKPGGWLQFLVMMKGSLGFGGCCMGRQPKSQPPLSHPPTQPPTCSRNIPQNPDYPSSLPKIAINHQHLRFFILGEIVARLENKSWHQCFLKKWKPVTVRNAAHLILSSQG